MKKAAGIVVLFGLLMLAACGNNEDSGGALEGSPSAPASSPSAPAEAASVAFVSPADGSTVGSPVQIEMEAEGFTLEPASEGVNENAGHLHVMIDTPCVAEGQIIPADDAHVHYGMAQTEAELTLEPGEHELCLQAADGAHAALPVTSTISIIVE